jgi:hypothetical protein
MCSHTHMNIHTCIYSYTEQGGGGLDLHVCLSRISIGIPAFLTEDFLDLTNFSL